MHGGSEAGQLVSSSLTSSEGDVTIRQEKRATAGHMLKCCFLYNLNLQQTDTAAFISYIKTPLFAAAAAEDEEVEEEKEEEAGTEEEEEEKEEVRSRATIAKADGNIQM